jgi:AsmA-like C-terminal region
VLMRFKGDEIVFENWEADLLGGSAKGTGHYAWTGNKPGYTFEGTFSRLNAASLGALLNSRWTGGPMSGSGSVQLSGLTDKELATSASGNLHFQWRNGSITSADSRETHFEDWSGTVAIQGGKAQVGENLLRAGKHSSSVAGTVAFGGPAKLTVNPSAGRLAANAVHPSASR